MRTLVGILILGTLIGVSVSTTLFWHFLELSWLCALTPNDWAYYFWGLFNVLGWAFLLMGSLILVSVVFSKDPPDLNGGNYP